MLRSEPRDPAAPESTVVPDLEAARREGDRTPLADRVVRYQSELGAPGEAVRAAGALGDPNAVVVVTGQQPGLLGGPLYTLHKALSAIAWARRIEAEHGVPAVPVFWAATEDHDLVEVNRVDILDATDLPHTLALDLEPSTRMLSEVQPGGAAAEIVAKAGALLPSSEFLEGLLATLEPGDGDSLGLWFARILSRWLGGHGLVVVEPRLFRREAAPLLALERGEPGAIRAGCGAGPLEVAETPFFLIEEGRRVRPGSVAELPADPEAVSFDVVTRVLAQNLVLPVAGHVVGPSEAKYCRQIAPAHALLGIPAPPLLPRASLTLVEGKVERALAAFETTAAATQETGEAALLAAAVRPEEFDRSLADLESALERALDLVKDEATRVDDVLSRKTAGAEKEIFRAIDRLRDHGRKAMDRASGRDRDRRAKVLAHLRPGDGAQERGLSPLPYLARHGPRLLDRLLEVVERWPDGARIVYLQEGVR